MHFCLSVQTLGTPCISGMNVIVTQYPNSLNGLSIANKLTRDCRVTSSQDVTELG